MSSLPVCKWHSQGQCLSADGAHRDAASLKSEFCAGGVLPKPPWYLFMCFRVCEWSPYRISSLSFAAVDNGCLPKCGFLFQTHLSSINHIGWPRLCVLWLAAFFLLMVPKPPNTLHIVPAPSPQESWKTDFVWEVTGRNCWIHSVQGAWSCFLDESADSLCFSS